MDGQRLRQEKLRLEKQQTEEPEAFRGAMYKSYTAYCSLQFRLSAHEKSIVFDDTPQHEENARLIQKYPQVLEFFKELDKFISLQIEDILEEINEPSALRASVETFGESYPDVNRAVIETMLSDTKYDAKRLGMLTMLDLPTNNWNL